MVSYTPKQTIVYGERIAKHFQATHALVEISTATGHTSKSTPFKSPSTHLLTNPRWSVSGGASTNPCDEDYKGAIAGDAPENLVLRNYIDKLASSTGVQLFIDLHSYSQLFMTPYGYSCTAIAPMNTALQSLARGVAAAIKAVYGTTYQYGPICSTIYQATGTSVDYVNDVSKSKYTFTIELRDTGNYGFVLPASQILPTGKETWEGFRYLLKNMT